MTDQEIKKQVEYAIAKIEGAKEILANIKNEDDDFEAAHDSLGYIIADLEFATKYDSYNG
jgi:hypothetical protein